MFVLCLSLSNLFLIKQSTFQMSIGRVFSVFLFVFLCLFLYLLNTFQDLNVALHNVIPIYGPANLWTDRDLVDWRQRREEVEQFCETQRLNSSQRQQLPKKMVIFEIKTNQPKLSINKILFIFFFSFFHFVLVSI